MIPGTAILRVQSETLRIVVKYPSVCQGNMVGQ